MPPQDIITDPTDWLPTPIPYISAIENALRCQVCKDFYQTPMITTCSHTFCSLCIRRYLNSNGKCPTCRTTDDVGKLRKNGAMEELVQAFVGSRADLLGFAQRVAQQQNEPGLSEDVTIGEGEGSEGRRGQKRKREESNTAGDSRRSSASPRRTRSSNKPQVSVTSTSALHTPPEARGASRPSLENEDGLVPCPICQSRMKAEQVFLHLDTHQEPPSVQAPQRPPSQPTIRPTPPAIKYPDRLPSLNYSLMSENMLRKKYRELGIPAHGAKQLLITRHKEWVDLVNANCDSSRPVSKRELLSHLDTWERTQGSGAAMQASAPNGVMKKDFDGDAWATKHKDDYRDLITRARQKAKVRAEASSEGSAMNGSGKDVVKSSPPSDDSGVGSRVRTTTTSDVVHVFDTGPEILPLNASIGALKGQSGYSQLPARLFLSPTAASNSIVESPSGSQVE
ncbi:E3 ubiquitin-protein ligase rad18 [Agyrium rufum]|nr:E3 ubiquitin-protein ligase rad18 [Agyrium rufum]